MTGIGLLTLTLVSMGWLYGSVTVFFSLPPLIQRGVEVPWPWLWILLPLVLDPGCVPGLFRRLRK